MRKVMLLGSMTLLSLAAVSLATLAQAPPAGPALVGTPRFWLKGGKNHTSGKCFGVQWFRGRKLLIAPLHLLGPTANYKTQITQGELNSKVDHVDVLDLSGSRVVDVARHSVLRKNLPVNSNSEEEPGDLMAFELQPRSRFPVLGFAPAVPIPPTRVAVLTYELGRSNQVARQTGSISEAGANLFIVQLDAPLVSRNSDGAPVVDQNNRLVGMILGPRDAARTHLTAMPCTSIMSRLTSEFGR
jgi:hypothetical protein